MNTDKPDTVFYALQIRRLAARHQAGEGLDDIKLMVDDIMRSIEEQYDYNYDYYLQMEKWAELFGNLDVYITKFSAPEWMTIIYYARRLVSRKKNNAKARLKYINSKD